MCKKSPVSLGMAGSSLTGLTLLLLMLLTGSEGYFRSSVGNHSHATCTREAETLYTCICHAGYQYTGYQIDGYSCLDIDECASNSTLCDNGVCVNKDGGFECDCDDGIVKSRDGKSCLTAYPVGEVEVDPDCYAISLEWPQLSGRVEWYSVSWWPLERHNGSYDMNSASRPKHRNGHFLIEDLIPGCGYKISVSAQLANHTKDLFTIESRTYPDIESKMSIWEENCIDYDECDPTLTVEFTETPRSATQFDKYRFRLDDGHTQRTISRPAEAPSKRVQFSGLVPGRAYNVTMWTVSGNVTSYPEQSYQIILSPRPIKQLNLAEIGTHHVSLTWEKPVGEYSEFRVLYYLCRKQNNSVKDLNDPDDIDECSHETYNTECCDTKQLGITVGQLQPHTLYLFQLTVCSIDRDGYGTLSKPYSKMVTTLDALPPAPYDFRVLEAQPRSLNFSWQLDPVNVDGVLRRFLLEYAPIYDPEAKTTKEFPVYASSGVVTNLVPGEYWISLRAETGVGLGPAAQLRARVDLEAPRVMRRSSTTVTVNYRVGFSAPVVQQSYSLVLAEQPHNDPPADLLWHDVRTLDARQLYQLNSSSVEEFTIGSESCTADGRGYCNGPLKPSTTYYVKLRVYTTPEHFTDSTYTVFLTDTTRISNTAIIILTICATALILLVIFFIAKKKRCWSKCNEPGRLVLPTCTQRKPFYLNLLFRKECAREIAEIERRDYDEIQENLYEEIGYATADAK